MSTSVGSIHYDLKLETKQFDTAVASISRKLEDVGSKMKNVGKNMTAFVTLPILGGMASAVKSASNLQETMNVVNVTFKDSGKKVTDWSKTSIKAMGMAQQTALDMAGTFGSMGVGMGQTEEASADMSMALTQLAGDMASFKNISQDRAKTALAGIYTGETEALKSLGVVMTQANLKTFAMNKGIGKNIEEMTQAELVQLRYNYVMEQTAFMQGDYVRTADGTANKTRTMTEKFKELSTTIGVTLQPYADKLLDWMTKVIEKFQQLTPEQRDWILKLLVAVATLGPLIYLLGQMTTAIGALLPLLGNPVFWVVVGVLALIAGIAYVVWKNWDRIKTKLEELKPIWDTFVDGCQWMYDKLKLVWEMFELFILPTLKKVWSFIKDQLISAWDSLKESFEKVRLQLAFMEPYWDDILRILGVILIGVLVVAVAGVVGFVTVLGLLIAIIARVVAWCVELAVNMRNMAGSVVNALVSVHSAVWGWIGNLVGAMVTGGFSMMTGLAKGIWNAMYIPIGAISSVMGRLRQYLPFSPAKEGPFSGKGWTLFSGRSMMEGLADGIQSMGGLPKMAMSVAMEGVSSASQTAPTSTTNNSVSINGPITLGDQSAVQEFFGTLNRNNELARKGMATL
jgi:hypothetical protein